MNKPNDHAYTMKNSQIRWLRHTETHYGLEDSRGVVPTDHGYVFAHRYHFPARGAKDQAIQGTMLSMCWEGKMHDRKLDKCYSRKHTVTLARRFAKEIAG